MLFVMFVVHDESNNPPHLQYWFGKMPVHTMAYAHYRDTGWIVLGQCHADSKFCTGPVQAQLQASI